VRRWEMGCFCCGILRIGDGVVGWWVVVEVALSGAVFSEFVALILLSIWRVTLN